MTSRQLFVAVLVVALLVMAVQPQPAEAEVGVALIGVGIAVVILIAFLIVANVHESRTGLGDDRPLQVVFVPPVPDSP